LFLENALEQLIIVIIDYPWQFEHDYLVFDLIFKTPI